MNKKLVTLDTQEPLEADTSYEKGDQTMGRRFTGKILLLLIDGFSEAQAMLYIKALRGAGLPLKTVGLSKRPVRGQHGVEILPDLSIDGVLYEPSPIKILILPNDGLSTSAWRADPRTNSLLEMVQEQGGDVVTTTKAVKTLQDLFSPDLFVHTEQRLSPPSNRVQVGLSILVAPTDSDSKLVEFAQGLAQSLIE